MSTYQLNQSCDCLSDAVMQQNNYTPEQIKGNLESQKMQARGSLVEYGQSIGLSGLVGSGQLGRHDPRQDPKDEYFGSQLNHTGITPVGYKILVEIPTPHDIQHAKDNGVVIPATAEDRYTKAAVAARVIQLGKDCYTADKFPHGPWCKPGDWVVMSPYSGTHIKAVIGGKNDFRFINDDSIEGLVPGSEYVERG